MTSEEAWCAARRLQVSEYLATEAARHGTKFGRVGDWPAWHVEPSVSVWLDYAPYLRMGQPHPEITIGNRTPDPELADLLESRAKLLLDWADDDSV